MADVDLMEPDTDVDIEDEPMLGDEEWITDDGRWRGPILALDTLSGDGRIVASHEGEISRPLPIRGAFRYASADWGGHDGAVSVGTIDRVWVDGKAVMGEGRLDMANPVARDVYRKIRDGFAGNVSVDLDNIAWEETEDGIMMVTDWRIAGATLVDIPAFHEASVQVVTRDEHALVAAVIGEADLPLAGRDHEWDGSAAGQRVAEWARDEDGELDGEKYGRAFFWRDPDADEDLVGSYKLGFADIVDGELVAVPRGVFAVAGVLDGARGGADIPVEDQDRIRGRVAAYYRKMAEQFDDPSIVVPWDTMAVVASVSWQANAFGNPRLSEPSAIDVAGELVFGHIALHATCHESVAAASGVCMTPPKSANGYASFHRYEIQTASGPVQVGRLTVGHGKAAVCGCCPRADDHACMRANASGAIKHHDSMEVAAYGRVGEDEHGIWFAGVVNPSLSLEGRAVLARRKVSGDWRGMELTEVLALSSAEPGFPVARAQVTQDGMALVAANVVSPDSQPRPGIVELDGVDVLATMVAQRLDDMQTARAAGVEREKRRLALDDKVQMIRLGLVREAAARHGV